MKIRHPTLIKWIGFLGAVIIRLWVSTLSLRYRSLGENAYPDRFIENGIAEQDMVSAAGGLARMGLLPVVNTFANFLAAR